MAFEQPDKIIGFEYLGWQSERSFFAIFHELSFYKAHCPGIFFVWETPRHNAEWLISYILCAVLLHMSSGLAAWLHVLIRGVGYITVQHQPVLCCLNTSNHQPLVHSL